MKFSVYYFTNLGNNQTINGRPDTVIFGVSCIRSPQEIIEGLD